MLLDAAYDAKTGTFKETRMNLYPAEGTGRIDETWDYAYDNLGRLLQTTVIDARTGETKTQKAYTYDDAGNRLTETENGQTTVNTYNLLNQLVTGGDTSYSYDANGNLTEENETDLVKQYTYDADNRLDTAVFTENRKTAVAQQNTYNGEGQRISKTENGITTNYSYQSGSVVYTDGSGNCKAAYEYTDFGETTVNGDFYNGIAYTGGIWDQNTGLYYLNARYYNPDDGRFLTEDTVRPDAENAATWHLYAYCANNPVNYVDPSGYSRIKAYSAAKIFNYRAFLYLGGLSITLVVKWKVKGKKIFYSSASISRKNAYGVARIKILKRVEKQASNQRQRVRVRYFVVLSLSNISDYFLNKYSLPIHEYCHPSAIVYNDGGVDWYKDGLK